MAKQQEIATSQRVETWDLSVAAIFLAVADQHMVRKDFNRERIWLFEEDVRVWLASEPLRAAVKRASRTLASGSRYLEPALATHPLRDGIVRH